MVRAEDQGREVRGKESSTSEEAEPRGTETSAAEAGRIEGGTKVSKKSKSPRAGRSVSPGSEGPQFPSTRSERALERRRRQNRESIDRARRRARGEDVPRPGLSEAERREQEKFLSKPIPSMETFDGPALRVQSPEYQKKFWAEVAAYRTAWERARLMTPREREESISKRNETILALYPPGAIRLGPGLWHPDGSFTGIPSIILGDEWTWEKIARWQKEKEIDLEARVADLRGQVGDAKASQGGV